MGKIHDSGYRKLFANTSIFRELMETFVHEDWVKDIDFDSCETLDKSFVSDHYKETESDIIYKAKFRDKEIYIFILMEFQSTVDKFMALRILNYITNFYMDYRESNKGVKRLPAVFPILLYNGTRKWTAATNISDLIENNEILGKFALNFEYFKIAENEYTKEELLRIKNIVSTLFLTEAHYDRDLVMDEFLEVFTKEEDKQAISLLLNWFCQLREHGRVSPEDYEISKKIYRDTQEVKEMLIESIKKEKQEFYQEGWEAGIEKGIKKGIGEGMQQKEFEIAKNMLLKEMDIDIISEITGLPEEKILKIKSTLLN